MGASRAVGVVAALLSDDQRDDFVEDIKETYEEMREEHYASLSERKFLNLEKARKNRLNIDYDLPANVPVTPKLLGTKKYVKYPIKDLLQYIDWSPFFHVWQLRGKYPNRGYPKIFQDETVGEEAKKLFEDAQLMLKTFIDQDLVEARGVLGIWPANSVGDDIEVYADESRGSPLGKFFTLRQQAEEEVDNYLALSDFIAPKSTGVADYIGAFAVSAGFGTEVLAKKFKDANDDFSGIMVEAIADRLAEALAEKLHEDMRKELWGYSPDEKLTPEDMLKVKYSGIRPAPGYPSQPDHTEKSFMWELLKADEQIGVTLTDTLAMWPAASVSALVFAAPESTYFQVGKVCKDQITSYAERKGMTMDIAEKWLGPYLAYDPCA